MDEGQVVFPSTRREYASLCRHNMDPGNARCKTCLLWNFKVPKYYPF
jgi:hypothetical protein